MPKLPQADSISDSTTKRTLHDFKQSVGKESGKKGYIASLLMKLYMSSERIIAQNANYELKMSTSSKHNDLYIFELFY